MRFFCGVIFCVSAIIMVYVIVIAMTFLLALVPEVANAEPGVIKENGLPSSLVHQCTARRAFVEMVISLRDKGHSKEEVIGMIMARAVEFGLPIDQACVASAAVNGVWGLEGDANTVGQHIFYGCIDGHGA